MKSTFLAGTGTRRYRALTAAVLLVSLFCPAGARAAPIPWPSQVQLSDGVIEGVIINAGQAGVRMFAGIPYAAPPVGEFRWRAPQPVARWTGVRRTIEFGPRCMQSDGFAKTSRSTRMSEDCLYLNVWAPPDPQTAKLPVLVYFHDGDFEGGDGSDARLDGTNFAAKGIVVVTVNYRLDVFGFFAHPDAVRESTDGTAGNYGFLDQLAALKWVRDNIERFGGDREQVTIGGQGAGAVSVSAHMASPLSRGLFARAIGQSAGAFAPINFWGKEDAARMSTDFAKHLGAPSLQALRSRPAQALIDVADPENEMPFGFWPSVDGYFLTDRPEAVFTTGAQARVPLLVGSNSQELHFSHLLKESPPTPDNWRRTINELFASSHSDEVMALYPGRDEIEVMRSGTALASDLMFGVSTRTWADWHRKTGTAPVYYYLFAQPRPPVALSLRSDGTDDRPQPIMGAEHGAEVEYIFDNLSKQPQYAWTEQDREVSRVLSGYVERFVKTGDPNSPSLADFARSGNRPSFQHDGLPVWPPAREERGGLLRQSIGSETRTILDTDSARYRLLEEFYRTSFPNVAGMKP